VTGREIASRPEEVGTIPGIGVLGATAIVATAADPVADMRASVIVLAAQLEAMRTLIGSIEKRIRTQHRSNEVSRRACPVRPPRDRAEPHREAQLNTRLKLGHGVPVDAANSPR
jgi:hypothetical protein